MANDRTFFQLDVATIPVGEKLPIDLYARIDSLDMPALRQGAVVDEMALRKLAADGPNMVVARSGDRSKLIAWVGGRVVNILERCKEPRRRIELALGMVEHSAELLFSEADLRGSDPRNCLSIVNSVAENFVRNDCLAAIPLPPTGQPHRLPVHATNVFAYSLALHRRMRLAMKYPPAHLAVGAFLHDMGMVGHLNEVASTPRNVTAAEYARIRQHTLWEPSTTAGFGRLKPMWQDVVRHHHERLDGNGYPDGLSGADISLPARIVGIVSAFSALTSVRPFAPARSAYEALDMMIQMSGQFDRDVLREFVTLIASSESRI